MEKGGEMRVLVNPTGRTMEEFWIYKAVIDNGMVSGYKKEYKRSFTHRFEDEDYEDVYVEFPVSDIILVVEECDGGDGS